MRFQARHLHMPNCLFGDKEPHPSAHPRFRQLRQFHPYDASRVLGNPHILFIFPDEYREMANRVYHSLRSGRRQFPGLKPLFGISIEKDSVTRVPSFSLPADPDGCAPAYEGAIMQYLTRGDKPDFAVVLCEKSPRTEVASTYYCAKALLASHGIPSQIITVDLLSNDQRFEWALADIALQMFVKLRGQPWAVVPSPGGGDVVIGVGRSERTDPRTGQVARIVGFTTCHTAEGVFRAVDVFVPKGNWSDYLSGLQGSVETALARAVAHARVPLRLVLHVTKRFSRDEAEHLEAALKSVSRDQIQYTVLRLVDEHPFAILDLNHETMAPLSGLCVDLDPRNHLLVLQGRPQQGNMYRPIPSPLWVTLQRASTANVDMDPLVQQIYDLAVANWRGFGAKARPITTHYAGEIARILSAALAKRNGMELVEQIASKPAIREVPWFI